MAPNFHDDKYISAFGLWVMKRLNSQKSFEISSHPIDLLQ